jgi:sortase (surface protein transpeptidase)
MGDRQRLSHDYTSGDARPTAARSRSVVYGHRSVSGKLLNLVGDVDPVAGHEPPKIHRGETSKLVEPRKIHQSLTDVHKPSADATAWRNIKPALPRQSRSRVLHRSMFGPKVAIKTHGKIRRQNRSFMPSYRVTLAVMLLIGGAGISINAVRIDRLNKNQVAVLASTTEKSPAGPIDETPPEAASLANYQVAPDLPRYLRISKIKVDARIKRLGALVNNNLDAPNNIYDVGWYENSAKPGEDGTMLLDGYIAGPTKRGVFYSLGNLQNGDKIDLERGDGKVITYKVVKQQLYDSDKVDMKSILNSAEPGKPGLNLITYSTRFDVSTNKFEQRLVIFAVKE